MSPSFRSDPAPQPVPSRGPRVSADPLEAAAGLRSGGIWAFPTETFYGLGCSLFDADAVRRVYQLKRRPVQRPLPVLAGGMEQLAALVRLDEAPRGLLEQFWPGPLTVLLSPLPGTASRLPDQVCGPTGKLAIRLTPHPLTARLSREAGAPLTCSSANLSGQPAARLARLDAVYTSLEDAPQTELLHRGHGWGALEQRRRARMGEPALPGWPEDGTETAYSPEEQPWVQLLEEGRMEPLAPGQLPLSWMTDPAWRPLLADAHQTDPSNPAVAAAFGVLEYENENWEEGAAVWRENWNTRPTAIVCRCLAQNSLRRGREPQARELMRQAMSLQGDAPHPALAAEYLTMLQAQSRWQELWDAFSALPEAVQQDERVMILAATAAGHLEQDEFLDRVFAHPFAVIREGETQLTDVWFAAMARRKAAAEGREDLDAVEREVRATMAPPDTIDFRLTGR